MIDNDSNTTFSKKNLSKNILLKKIYDNINDKVKFEGWPRRLSFAYLT